MPRKVAPPVIPPVSHWKGYERALRRNILNPIVNDFTARIRLAGMHYAAIQQAIAQLPANPALAGLSKAQATAFIMKLEAYHQRRFRRIMKVALGVKVLPLAPGMHFAPILEAAIQANVDLIKTIPARFHTALKTEMLNINRATPFDQHAVSSALKKSYKVGGYTVRRIARDQTSKTIGKLSEARQVNLGIVRYQWRTAADERVRETHQQNDGAVFRWDQAPSTGHPGDDIQCRCVAMAVLDDLNRAVPAG